MSHSNYKKLLQHTQNAHEKHAKSHNSPLTIGLSGAQGCGKTTLAQQIAANLNELNTVILSLDDFYLIRKERKKLAKTIHPLFATRGVPGTHDVNLALTTIKILQETSRLPTPDSLLPRFDKAADNRLPKEQWTKVAAPPDLILFEGWCLGAIPQPEEALAKPVNTLETQKDAQGIWRKYANEQLAGPYQQLWGLLDCLIYIQIPGWDVVLNHRWEQEEKLKNSGVKGHHIMSHDEIFEFTQHFERLTRWMMEEMPGRVGVCLKIDDKRNIISINSKSEFFLNSPLP